MVRYFDDYLKCHLHKVILRERNLGKEQDFTEIVNGTFFGRESLHSSEWQPENEEFGIGLLKFLSPANVSLR